MYPRVLKELAFTIVRLLSSVFERSCLSWNVPVEWRKADKNLIFKNRQACLVAVCYRRIIEQTEPDSSQRCTEKGRDNQSQIAARSDWIEGK